MAAPTYDTDLSDITLAETLTASWVALGGGASGLGAGVDFSMQGQYCIDKQITGAEKGQVYNNGGTITPGASTHFFVWIFLATPGLSNTLQLRGLCAVLGTATTAYVQFHVEGKDTYGAVGRVGRCYPIRYVTSQNLGGVPYRTVTGSPGANPQYFGATANITGAVKSSNLGVDAIRYGTGGYITAGEQANPATFTGFAGQNDNSTYRWGILTAVGGTFELQGRFVVGQTKTYTVTAAYFSDSNKFIALVDTPHSLTDFTQIIVDHASTTFNLTNVTILALGTNNPGKLVFNNASTTAALTGCTFEKIGETVLRAGVTATGCTWRGTGLVTQNNATITSCKFENLSSSSSILSDNPSKITDCSFVSDGSNHAVEATTACAGNSYDWNGIVTSGYAAVDGSSGNEVFYNNSQGQVTLTVATGTVAPTVRNGTNASTVINQNPITLGYVVTDENNDPIDGALCYIDNNDQVPYILNTTTDVNGEASVQYSGGAASGTRWRVRMYGYKPFKQIVDIAADNIILPVTLIVDPQQT